MTFISVLRRGGWAGRLVIKASSHQAAPSAVVPVVFIVAMALWSGGGVAADTPQPAQAAAVQDDAEAYPGVITLPAEPSAQDAAAPVQLDPIIVTASKREQQRRDVAGSVDAVSGADLDGIQAQGLPDYVHEVPGLLLLERGVGGNIPVIRGVTTVTGELGTIVTQLPVGVYINDMPFTDLYIPLSLPDLQPFDLERVEVLKGPQGTLFGSGALAGAVRYVLKPPMPGEWQTRSSSSVSQSRYSEGLSHALAAAQNIPLFGDEGAIRLVGTQRRQRGRIDETERGRDLDEIEQFSGRLQARWEPGERLSLNGFVLGQRGEQANFSGADNPEDFERELTGDNWRQSGFAAANLAVDYGWDGLHLHSTSNFLRKDVKNDGERPYGTTDPNGDPDGDGGENGPGTEDAGDTETLHGQLYSQTAGLFQEFRLRSPEEAPWRPRDWAEIDWLLGLGYQRTGQDWQQYLESTVVGELFAPVDALPLLPLETPQGPVSGSRDASLLWAELDSIATEAAVFGEATARLGEHWDLTLGGRGFWTKLDVDGHIWGAQTAVLDGGRPRVDVMQVIRAQGFNPKLALRYLFNDALQVYALASRGFQFGGIQINPPVAGVAATAPEIFKPYKSSTLWNYELGLRSVWFGSRLQADLTAFYQDWTDLQITQRKPFIPEGERVSLTLNVTENIGSAVSRGVEAALAAKLAPGLDLNSSAAWIDARTTEDFDSAAGFVPAGSPLPGSPRWQWSNRLDYRPQWAWLGHWGLGASLRHAHVGRSYNNLQKFREQGDYDIVDLHLRVHSTQAAGWQPELSLALRNLADVRGISAVTGNSGGRDVFYYFVAPRTLSLSVGFQL